MLRPASVPAFVAMLILAGLPVAARAQFTSPPARPIDVICSLRQGGYVIYLHHGDVEDTPERNLTDEGRAEAQAVGEGFAALAIPVGQVLSSPFDRTLETARLAFGRSETVADLAGFPPTEPDPDAGRRIAALQEMLGEAPLPGTNTVLVSHYEMLLGASGIATGPAEAVVYRPTVDGGYSLITRITWDEWVALVEAWNASPSKC